MTTFSWLARPARGRGLGRDTRSAVLHLAFEGLDAAQAQSEAFVDNVGSNRISESLGYRPNGTSHASRLGVPGVLQRWVLDRRTWEAGRRADIALRGVEACRATSGVPERVIR